MHARANAERAYAPRPLFGGFGMQSFTKKIKTFSCPHPTVGKPPEIGFPFLFFYRELVPAGFIEFARFLYMKPYFMRFRIDR